MNSSSSIASLLSFGVQQLSDAGIDSARLDVDILLGHVLKKERSFLRSHAEVVLDNDTAEHFLSLVARRKKREPIAYITGEKYFYGRLFDVTKDTLIPRPETETLIEETKLLDTDNKKIIDVGCGSGIIGITLALELPHIRSMTLVDVSVSALEVTRTNCRKYGTLQNITLVQSNLLEYMKSSGAQADIIIANLPYVSKKWQRSPETDYEPAIALFAKNDGLQLMKLLMQQTQLRLANGGFLLLECDPCQFPALKLYAKKHQLRFKKSIDYSIVFEKISSDLV